jgi:hypothetical protein
MNKNLDRIIGKTEKDKQGDWQPPLTPMKVAERESFLPFMPPDQSSRWLSVGASLVDICPSGVNELEGLMIPKAEKANGTEQYEKYIIKVLPPSRSDDGVVQLTFFEGASDIDLLQGMFHAYSANVFMRNDAFDNNVSKIMNHSHMVTKSQLPQFLEMIHEEGWQMETGFVNVECGSSCRLKIREL